MEETGWRVARIEEIPARDAALGARWHSIRDHFGILGFGINANEAGTGEELVEPHDELAYGGQEELFLVVRGRARFSCDSTEVELGPGGVLYARPEVRRSAVALETPTLVVMVGGRPGHPYEVPEWDRG